MSDFLFPTDGVALPQLSITSDGDSVSIPNVSPGHTDGSPNSVDTRNGADCQPLRIENVRRYMPYPAGSLSVSVPTYAVRADHVRP